MDLISVTATLLGILSIIVGFAVVVRGRQLSSPKLHLDFGLRRDLRKNLPSDQRRQPITIVAYGAGDPDNADETICTLPCLLENTGRLPLRGLTLQFEYPVEYTPPTPDEVQQSFPDDIRLIPGETFSTHRVAGYAQSRREIAVLRPGEQMGVGEPLSLTPYRVSVGKGGHVGAYGHALSALIDDGTPILGLCPMRVFLYCEDLAVSRRDILVIWLKGNKTSDVNDGLQKIAAALWERAFPKRKVIIKYPWETILTKHLAVVMAPNFMASQNTKRRLMEDDLSPGQMSVSYFALPEKRPFGDLHRF